MKVIVLTVVILCLCAGIGLADDKPKREWTSGNYFDVLLFAIELSPLQFNSYFGLNYWSGFHHLSFPMKENRELYVGIGWSLFVYTAEIGIGWNIRSSSRVTWEPHVTLFGGMIPFERAIGLRSALKYQLTVGKKQRTHLFAGTGLTLAYSEYGGLAFSIPFETGLTISSKKIA